MKREILKEAISSILNNRLRSILTISIIGIGITALVSSMTATNALIETISKNFEEMGMNNISITNNNSSKINQYDIKSFKTIYQQKDISYETDISIFTKYKDRVNIISSNNIINNCTIIGADSHFLKYKNIHLKSGRNFYTEENSSSSHVCLAGKNIAAKQKNIKIQSINFEIIGRLKEYKQNTDLRINNSIIIPYNTAKKYYTSKNTSYKIGIIKKDKIKTENDKINIKILNITESIFRNIRRLRSTEINDFEIKNNLGTQKEVNNLYLLINNAAKIIGLITLLGASICLMNIMLVSVKERTNEIGTRIALGAKRSNIKTQFIIESLLIGQTGGTLGLLLGIIIGNICAVYMDTKFHIPWNIFSTSIITCLIVSLVSAYIPAKKAANLNPIKALHYE